MDLLQLPAFGESEYIDTQVTGNCRVLLISNATAAVFENYCNLLEEHCFQQPEQYLSKARCYAAYCGDGIGIFLNFYAGTGQLQIITEKDCKYFSYEDTSLPSCCTPRLTQLFLCDYGMSYVLRLSDGRLVIIDGANVYEKDVDNLFARLQKDSPVAKPVIAAWIFTHPHSDHYFCFFPFMEKYAYAVEIQKFFFHFPEADDFTHYPRLGKPEKVFAQYSGEEGITSCEILHRFYEKVAQLRIPVYIPHSGQSYRLGDAALHFYSTMDDTIHCSQNINASSLMFTVELAGQKIFFGADGSFSDALLAERYGNELKSDMLQFPHHGFASGSADGQIRALRLIAPQVCILPVEQDLAYRTFTTYVPGTNYMMTRLGIEELITGEKEQILALPYTARPDGQFLLQQNYLRGRDDAGARTWVFSDLNTGNSEDFWFSFLNTTYLPAQITAELYFVNEEKNIRRFSFTGPRLGVYLLHFLLPNREDPAPEDPSVFLAQLGIPENTPFTVRFLSDLPVVVSHKNHMPVYHSSVI